MNDTILIDAYAALVADEELKAGGPYTHGKDGVPQTAEVELIRAGYGYERLFVKTEPRLRDRVVELATAAGLEVRRESVELVFASKSA